MTFCIIPNCERPALKRGMCNAHYLRWWRHGDPLSGGADKGAALAFLEAALSHDGDECLIWPFYRTKEGYGGIHLEGRCQIVSRVVCEKEHGPPIFDGAQAAHSCGNGHLGCINRHHLRWATYAENRLDMINHGRSNRGKKNPFCKLSDSDVREIKSLLGAVSQRRIATKFNVSQSTISSIHTGRAWSWMEIG